MRVLVRVAKSVAVLVFVLVLVRVFGIAALMTVNGSVRMLMR